MTTSRVVLYWNKRTVENLAKRSPISKTPPGRSHLCVALCGNGDCYISMSSVQMSALPPPEARRRAEAAALKALELDPTLAEAHSALGSVRLYSWDWTAAEEECKRAIELNPNYANAHNAYAHYLISRGRTDEHSPQRIAPGIGSRFRSPSAHSEGFLFFSRDAMVNRSSNCAALSPRTRTIIRAIGFWPTPSRPTASSRTRLRPRKRQLP